MKMNNNTRNLTLDDRDQPTDFSNINILGIKRSYSSRNRSDTIHSNKKVLTHFLDESTGPIFAKNCNFNLKKLKNRNRNKHIAHDRRLFNTAKVDKNLFRKSSGHVVILQRPRAPHNTSDFLIHNFRKNKNKLFFDEIYGMDELILPGGTMNGIFYDMFIELNNGGDISQESTFQSEENTDKKKCIFGLKDINSINLPEDCMDNLENEKNSNGSTHTLNEGNIFLEVGKIEKENHGIESNLQTNGNCVSSQLRHIKLTREESNISKDKNTFKDSIYQVNDNEKTEQVSDNLFI